MAQQLNLFGEPVREKAEYRQGMVGRDDYEEFITKFDNPKTTDDCYTPQEVYDAVLGWLRERVDLTGRDIVRPFYPGGDYESYPYKGNDVVVDNPPFSIISRIIRFYCDRGIGFFLFAPQLTLFPKKPLPVTAIGCAAPVEYANGAKVNTGFLTNLLGDVAAMSAPDLRERIKAALGETRLLRAMPVYKYPDEVLTASMLGYMSTHGVEFSVRRSDVAACIVGLASQKKCGKSIYGGGLLIAERAAAERAAAEKAAAIVWELSPAELDALWRRVEWLCRDTDDRLSADRVAIQRVSIRARSLHKRVRRCEKELYIAADGTDAEEDGV